MAHPRITSIYITKLLRDTIKLIYNYRRYRYFLLCLLGVIALVSTLLFSPRATAKLFDGPVDILPVEQRVSLRRGEVIFLGKDGSYTCRILAKSSVDNAWQVLTDYDHFAEFLPGIKSSQLVEANAQGKIFEQVNKVKTFVFNIESRVRIATTESYPEQIAFKAIEGDLEALNGEWILEPVSPYPSAPPDQVLMTHKVTVEPAKTPSDSIFFDIYESTLKETIAAIKTETEKRSANDAGQ